MTILHVCSKKVCEELVNAIRQSKNWKNTVFATLNEYEIAFESRNDAMQLLYVLREDNHRAWIVNQNNKA